MRLDSLLNSTRIHNFNKQLEKSGLSLTLFCKTLGLYTSNMSNILNGKRPFSSMLAGKIESSLELKPFSLSQLYENTKISRYNGEKADLLDKELYGFIDRNNLNIENLSLILASDKIVFDFNYTDNILKVLIDLSDKNLLDDKLYLLKYRNYVFIRRFNDNYFMTNDQAFYANIINNELVELLGRVIAVFTIKAF